MSDWSSEVCSSDLARIRMHTVLLTPVILLARALPKPCRRTSSTARRFALLYRAPLYCSPLPGGGSGALSRAFRSTRYLRRCSETHAALTPKPHWRDRKSVVEGKRVSVRVVLGGGRN